MAMAVRGGGDDVLGDNEIGIRDRYWVGITTPADRLFLLLDPHTRRVVDLCTGPTAAGGLPRLPSGQPLTCAGYRVVPSARPRPTGCPSWWMSPTGPAARWAWIDDAEPNDGAGAAVVTPPARRPDPAPYCSRPSSHTVRTRSARQRQLLRPGGSREFGGPPASFAGRALHWKWKRPGRPGVERHPG